MVADVLLLQLLMAQPDKAALMVSWLHDSSAYVLQLNCIGKSHPLHYQLLLLTAKQHYLRNQPVL